jgi:hypothetical protein
MVSGYSTSAGISNFAQNPSGTAGTLPVMSNQGAFIAKWNSSGVYQGSAYVDGTGYEQGNEVVCDGSGNVYMAGFYSGASAAISNFNVNPSGTAGTLPATSGGSPAAFIAKWNASGVYQGSALIDGTGFEIGLGVACDGFGRVYMSGVCSSAGATITNFNVNPSGTAGTLPATSNEGAFIAKWSASGNYISSAYIDGLSNEAGLGVACDGSSNVYMSGVCSSAGATITNFNVNPSGTAGTLPVMSNQGAFIAKWNASGNYISSAYIDGLSNEAGVGVACDGSSNVYMVGAYGSTSATITNFNVNPSGTAGTLPEMSNQGAFIAKWNASGNYISSAYVEGTGNEQGTGVVCDGSGNVYMSGVYNQGSAGISNFNVNPSGTAGTLPETSEGSLAAFIARWNASGNYISSAYVEGTGIEKGLGVACDSSNVYLVGAYGSAGATISSFDQNPSKTAGTLPAISGSDGSFIAKWKTSLPVTGGRAKLSRAINPLTTTKTVFSRTYVPPVPGAVTGFVASNPTGTTIDLYWNASSGATSYDITSYELALPPPEISVPGYTYVPFQDIPQGFTLSTSNGPWYLGPDFFTLFDGGGYGGSIATLYSTNPIDIYPGAWYTLTNGSGGYTLHSVFDMYLGGAFQANSFDFAWALYLKNGTTDQVIIRNPYPGDGIGYWVKTLNDHIRIDTQNPEDAQIFTISIPLTITELTVALDTGTALTGKTVVNFGYTSAMSSDGNTIVVTGLGSMETPIVYRFSGGSWDTGTALTGKPVNNFGNSSAMSSDGNTIVVTGQGSMATPIVYRFSGGSWDTGTALTGKPVEGFGRSSAMSSDGNTIVVAGNTAMETPIVYRFSGGSWDTGTALTGKTVYGFGWSSAMSSDGNTIVVTGQGSMATPIVYRFSGGSWDTGTPLTGKPLNAFGWSSAMSSDGNTIVVTGLGSMATPIVYRFSGGSWDIGTALTGKSVYDFGWSSAMSSDGNTIVVTGQSYMATPFVYRFLGGSWDTGTALTGKDITAFGNSSAMSSDGNTIVVTGQGSMETPFVYRALTQTQTTSTVPPPPFTFTGLTPLTAYTFSITPSNASGNGPPTNLGTVYNTLFEPIYLTYTGTIGTLSIAPGNYRITMAGGSGPERDPSLGGGGRFFSDYTVDYTVTSPIVIQYAIGQASPGYAGGAGGTYMYDTTNSQWLFVAGGAGTNAHSPVPHDDVDPGDGSGGAAGSGGGSGAGVNSNGSNSTANGGLGGLTFGNGAAGGTGGTIGTAYNGGFGGGGGGAIIVSDFILGPVYYPGGGGGYTGGTTTTNYVPGNSANWSSTPGTSYAIAGATIYGTSSSFGDNPAVNGYITIIINPDL